MHPAMAVWIWSMAMARAWQSGLGVNMRAGPAEQPESPSRETVANDPTLVLANAYLYSDVAEKPLPDTLLDRLADLYWTERDAELAI